MLKSMIAIAAVALSAASVSAATVQVVNLGFANAPLAGNPTATSVDPATSTTNPATGVLQNITGSSGGNFRSVWQSNVTTSPAGGFNPGAATSVNSEATVPYTSVSNGATARYEFGGLQKSIHLAWGSPDSFNLLTFFNGTTSLGSIGGATDFDPVTPGVQSIFSISSHNSAFATAPNGLAYVKLSLKDGFSDVFFNAIEFKSTGANAFEFAALKATPVPVPAGLALALTGLAGAVALRRRKAQAA